VKRDVKKVKCAWVCKFNDTTTTTTTTKRPETSVGCSSAICKRNPYSAQCPEECRPTKTRRPLVAANEEEEDIQAEGHAPPPKQPPQQQRRPTTTTKKPIFLTEEEEDILATGQQPPPRPSQPQKEEEEEYKAGDPYEFTYSVKDEEHGNDYSHQAQSKDDVVTGEYRVLMPDGRTQIVTYTADWKNGFRSKVTYEGEISYKSNSNQSRREN
jgi:hypothetical protein